MVQYRVGRKNECDRLSKLQLRSVKKTWDQVKSKYTYLIGMYGRMKIITRFSLLTCIK